MNDLHYGVLVEGIAPAYKFVKLDLLDLENGKTEGPRFPLPTLGEGENPVDSRIGFEGQTFPPQGWELHLPPGSVCQPDAAAALTGSLGLLCQDLLSAKGTLIRAGLRFALPVNRLPVRPMSWRYGQISGQRNCK